MARARKTCSRCGDRGYLFDWTLSPCSMLPKQIRGRLCARCDIELNEFVLSWFRVRNRKKLMEDYAGGLT